MGKRQKQPAVKKDVKKSKETGNEPKPVSMPKRGVKKKYQGSHHVQGVKTCDVMMMSQSDSMSEVAWDNQTPTRAVHHDQTDIGDLVKRFTTESSSQASDEPPSTPPLVSMWMDSPGEDVSGGKSSINKTRRRKIHRPKRHPLLKREVLPSSDILSKLAEVLQSEKERGEEQKCMDSERSETGTKLQSVENLGDICSSTQGLCYSNVPTPLQTADISPILQAHRTRSNDKIDAYSPIEPHALMKHSGSLYDTPKGTLKRTYVPRNMGTPKSAIQHNCSSDELWTDEELFENDSFLRATQSILDTNSSSSPRFGGKRKLATPVRDKKRQTFQLDTSPCLEKSRANRDETIGDIFKKPSAISENKVDCQKKSTQEGEGLFKVPGSVANTVGSNTKSGVVIAPVSTAESNLRSQGVSQSKQPAAVETTVKGPNSINTSKQCNVEDKSVKNKNDKKVSIRPELYAKPKDKLLGNVTKHNPNTKNSSKSAFCVQEKTVVSVVSSTVTMETGQSNVTLTNQTVRNPAHHRVTSTLTTPVVETGNMANCLKATVSELKVCQVKEDTSIQQKVSESVSVAHGSTVCELDLSMSEELLTMLAEPDNILDSQVALFDDTVSIGDHKLTTPWICDNKSNQKGTTRFQDSAVKSKIAEETPKTQMTVLPILHNNNGQNHVFTDQNLGNRSKVNKVSETKPVPAELRKLKTEMSVPSSQEALFNDSVLSDSVLEQSECCIVTSDNSEPLFGEPLVTDCKSKPTQAGAQVCNTMATRSVIIGNDSKAHFSVAQNNKQGVSGSNLSINNTKGAIPQYNRKTQSASHDSSAIISRPKVATLATPPSGKFSTTASTASTNLLSNKTNEPSSVILKCYSNTCPRTASVPDSAISMNAKPNGTKFKKLNENRRYSPILGNQSTVSTGKPSVVSSTKPQILPLSSIQSNITHLPEKVSEHSNAKFKFSRASFNKSSDNDHTQAVIQRSDSGSSTETLYSSSTSDGSGMLSRGDSGKVDGKIVTMVTGVRGESGCQADIDVTENWLAQEELLELLEKSESQGSEDISKLPTHNSKDSTPPTTIYRTNQQASKNCGAEIIQKNTPSNAYSAIKVTTTPSGDTPKTIGIQATNPNVLKVQATSQNVQKIEGSSQSIQKHQGTAQNLQTFQGIGQNIQKFQGIAQNVQKTQGIGQNIQKFQGIAQNVQKTQAIAQNVQKMQGIAQNVQQSFGDVKNSKFGIKTAVKTDGIVTTASVANPSSVVTPFSSTKGKSARTLMKYPSFDSLNTHDSPKTVIQDSLSSSQDSKVTPVKKCSPQEIERKRLDALKKRQNRLKLSKCKR